MKHFVGNLRVVRLLARPLAMLAIWLDGHGVLRARLLLVRQVGQARGGDHFHGRVCHCGRGLVCDCFIVGARKRWAIEAALPMAILMAAPVCLAGALTWLAPTLSGSLPRIEYFPHYRRPSSHGHSGNCQADNSYRSIHGCWVWGRHRALDHCGSPSVATAVGGLWRGCSSHVSSVPPTLAHLTVLSILW